MPAETDASAPLFATDQPEPTAPQSPSPLTIGRIYQGDCLELMREIEAGTIDLAFADPPFNIGYEYDEYHDRQDDEDYIDWSRQWMEEVYRVLRPGGTFWLAIGDEYAAELKVDAEHKLGFSTRSWVVWYYTFGVNCKQKFSRSHVHLFHFVKDENNYTFNAEDPQVRVPSARALVYADKRANPAGRLPDDTWVLRPAPDGRWVLRPQDLPEGFQPADDTWYYARVAGTFKERQGFHGCQMPEQLLGRIIRVSSNPDDIVLDPFAGSGTTLAVAKKLGRRWIGCELSAEYVRAATERLDAIREGDSLDGPADPIASAPSTANGRRLEREPVDDKDKETGRQGDKESVVPSPCLPLSLSPPLASTRDRIQTLRALVREAIADAYFAAHDGYSTDWLLADPALQAAFHEACRETGLIGGPADWNRELLRLRKQGAIPKRGGLKKVQVTATELDAYEFAAEIAWRLATDKFADTSLDEIFCDPAKAAFFDRAAKRFMPAQLAKTRRQGDKETRSNRCRSDLLVSPSPCLPVFARWAALRLRKASRQLVSDVKQYHFVFAKRDFARFQAWRKLKPPRFAGQPGIYLLRDDAKQSLYIGRTLELGRRLAQHADTPTVNDSVAHVSLLTGNDLPGQEYQAAFKEELIRRHGPRWNVNLVGLQSITFT